MGVSRIRLVDSERRRIWSCLFFRQQNKNDFFLPFLLDQFFKNTIYFYEGVTRRASQESAFFFIHTGFGPKHL